jgi:hypothetical protein
MIGPQAPDAGQDVMPIRVREGDVEQNQIVQFGADHQDRILARFGHRNLIALALESTLDDTRQQRRLES